MLLWLLLVALVAAGLGARALLRRHAQRAEAAYDRVIARAARLRKTDPAQALALLRRVFAEVRARWPHGGAVVVEPWGRFEPGLLYRIVPPLFDIEFEDGDPREALSVAEWVNTGVFRDAKDPGWISLQAACLYRLGRRAEAKSLLLAHVEHDNASGCIRNMLAWVHDREGAPN